MLICDVIDDMYGPGPRLDILDIKFLYEINEQQDALNCRQWPHSGEYKDVTKLSYYLLMEIYVPLITNTTMLFRDEWRKIILEEIKKRINSNDYEIY